MPFRRIIPQESSNQSIVPSTNEKPQGQPIQEATEPQGWPSYLLGEASRMGAKALSNIAGFPADIGHAILGPQQEMIEKLRQKVPTEGIITPFGKLTSEKYEGPPALSSEFYFEKLYKPLVAKGLPENYAKAQTALGEILDTTAENLAIGGLLGAGTLGQLGLGAVGSALGKHGAKALELGPLGQAAGSLIGGVGAQAASGLWKARPQLKALQDIKYDARDKIAKKTWGDAKDLEHKLLNESIYIERHAPFTSTERKEIYDRLDTIGKLTSGGKLNLMDAVEQEKALNGLLYNKEFDLPARQFIGKIKTYLRDFINEHGSKEFLKDHKEANNLWLALKGNDLIGKAIENATDYKKALQNPLSKMLLTGVGLSGVYINPAVAAKILGGIAVTYGTRGLYRALSAFAKDPHARELYTNILLDAGSGKLAIASKDAVKHVEQFDKYVTKKMNAIKTENPKRFRRVLQ